MNNAKKLLNKQPIPITVINNKYKKTRTESTNAFVAPLPFGNTAKSPPALSV